MHRQVSGWVMMAGLACVCCVSQAATRIKADNTNNLNLTTSWVGGSVPGTGDVALWTNTVTSANAALLGANLSVQGLWIVNPGGEVGIGGANTLTLGYQGVLMKCATADLTLTNQNVVLLDYVSQPWNVTNARTFKVNPGVVTRGTGAALSVQGAGFVASSAITNNAAGIVGPWASYGTGASTKYATVSGGVITGLSGTAVATAAGVTDATGLMNYDVAAVGTLGAGASFNTLRYTGAAGTVAGNAVANGILNSGSGALTLSGAVTVGAGRELLLTSPDTTRTITLSGAIGDNAGGASGVTVTGGGKVSLTENNTYSGAAVVSAGTLYVTKTNALGNTTGNTVVYVNGSSTAGGLLQISGNNLTVAEPITFVGPGDGAPWVQAFQATGGTNSLTGPITIAMSSGVRLTAGGAGTALNLNGPITRTGSGSTLILGAGGAGGVVNVNYPINNNGGGVNLHSGPGTIRFNVSGHNITAMNVQWGHLLQIGVSDALPTGQSLQVGDASTASGGSAWGSFDLAGFNQTVGAFYGDGPFAVNPPSTRVITNSAAGLSTFTIGNANGGGTFNGVIAGNLALVKTGTGTEILCGPNRYTGGTTVNNGTLVLSNAVNHGALAVNGGTFRFPPALTVNGTLSGGGGTIDTGDATSVLTVNQATNTTFAGVLSNAGALVKNGSGVLTLSGSNTYSGGTTVASGVLCFGKSVSKPTVGTVTVAAGAGLCLGVAGTGTFVAADVDALWTNAVAGVSLDDAARVGIDTSAGGFTYSTSLSTSRGLVKVGANTLTLSGVNTYGGGTIIQSGVLSIPSTSALPGWNAGGSYSVWRDAGLAVWNAVNDSDVATILGTGNFAAGGCIGFDTVSGNRTYANVISNTVNGALGVYKLSTNTLTLTANNSYDGNTYVAGGFLAVRHSNALGSTNGYTVVNRVGGTAGLNYSDATGQVQLDGSGGALEVGEDFLVNGTEQCGYTGPIRNMSGNNVISGTIRLMASGRVCNGGGNLLLKGPIVRTSASGGPSLVLNPQVGTVTVSNTIDIGTGGLSCHSAGTVALCATGNVWTSSTAVQYGCTLRLAVGNALPTASVLVLGNPEPGNGRFDLGGFSQTVGGLAEYGTVASLPNNVITNSFPANFSTLTVSQAAGVSNSFGGRILGAVNLVKGGATNSVLTLREVNGFSGATTVGAGTLAITATGSLGEACTNVVIGAGKLSLQNSAALANSATLSVAGGGGAKVDLAAGVNESVRYLYLGDKMQRVGTYGSSSSAAANKNDACFSGTGVLTVLRDNSGTLLRLQ